MQCGWWFDGQQLPKNWRISGLWTTSSDPILGPSAKNLVCVCGKVAIWFYARIWAHMARIIHHPSEKLASFLQSRCHSLKLALTNKPTPILHSSPTILVKSQKIYYTGRQLRGHGHEFVRMRRTRATRHVQLPRPVMPSLLRRVSHISQETCATKPISKPPSNFQIAYAYR